MKASLLAKSLIVVLIVSLISACSDDTQVTLHEAHVYKGNVDIHKYGSEYQEKRLQQRTLLVFTDR